MRWMSILLVAYLFAPVALRAEEAPNPIHPTFPVLDDAGQSVLVSGAVPSSDRTCGTCHDVTFIRTHDSHIRHVQKTSCIECHVEGSRLPTTPEAFDSQGLLRREAIRISAPRDQNCAYCHGIVHHGPEPLTIPEGFEGGATDPKTFALTRNTGEILSSQNISDSFLNIEGKDALARPWDVHSQRLVRCISCHFARNNPAKADMKHTSLDFLVNDPRKVSMAEFLHRPDHELLTAQCQSCHDPMATHKFLPYLKRHMQALDCRACHVPTVVGPAAQAIDQTVVTEQLGPRVEYRGLLRRPGEPLNTALNKGYVPFLLRRVDLETGTKVAPFNVVTRWYWASGRTGAEVPWDKVVAAWRDGDQVPQEVLAAFDANGDGRLSDSELLLDTPAKVDVIRRRLVALGVADPVIKAAVEPHEVKHGVVAGKWVRRDCASCHSKDSLLDRDIFLAASVPGGVLPTLPSNNGVELALEVEKANGLVLRRGTLSDMYIFGHSRRTWIDFIGFLGLGAMVVGIGIHAGLRIRAGRRRPATHGPLQKVYMYPLYERLWHWTMALSVMALMVTGIIIHFASTTGPGLQLAVAVHNVFAVILTINAGLSLFYHIASGAIRQFLPNKNDLVGQVKAQAKYYLGGIFLGQPHPNKKSPERKLNPLQQLTYLALLNILFPFQLVTGILIWGASRWPDLAGGLAVVAPLHHLGSWMFLWFFVLHHYLTTTGLSPLEYTRAMLTGWEEVEVEGAQADGGAHV